MAGLDTIPGQTGYLVISADGSVLQSAGELQNDEYTGSVMLQMVKSSNKLLSTLNGEGKGVFHRVSVMYRHHSLVASVWNQRIYIVKRINRE